MFKHLRTKLTVLYAALFAATLAVIAFAVFVATSENVERIGRDQLAASGTVFDNLLASRNAALEDKAQILAQDYGFRAALATGDAATVRSALDNLAARLGIDLAYVVDMQGRVIGRSQELDADLPADVAKAVKGDDPISGIVQLHGKSYEAVSTPIMMPAPSGWVVFASALDGGDMARLERLSAIPLHATVVGTGSGQALTGGADTVLRAFVRKAAAASIKVERLQVPGTTGQSLTLVHRLAGLGDGQPVLMLRYPLADALKPFDSLFESLLAIGFGGMPLVLVGSWLIARSVTRPISVLEDAARRLQHGETARVEIGTADEIARLGSTFNAMANDILERQAGLEQARDRAEAADRAKGQFLANMNHEIRTPLNGVLGGASVLATTALNADQRRMLDLIQASGEGLQGILNAVLDMVELGSGDIRLTEAPFDIWAALGELADAATATAAAKGLAFHRAANDPDHAFARGDRRRVSQILLNLIDNAVKFTEAGTVSVSGDWDAGRGYRFEVRDTGIGFDPARLEEMFVPFQQADGTMTRQYGGAGLGLGLARDLARAMGGDITATGTPGVGSVFVLTLPLAMLEAPPTPVAEPARSSAPAADPQDRPIRVLLAEDNPANRTVVELILGAVDVEMVSTENGAEAVDAFATQAFDVVLMDLQMPVMDGLTAIGRIRRLEADTARPRTPIIVLSANVQTEHLQASVAAGADLHLAKPIVAGVLIGALEAVLIPADADPALAEAS